MVVHDREREQEWVLQQQTRSQQKSKNKHRSPKRISLLAMQSLACAVILLLALLFRIAGGDAYARLQQGFSNALAGNELMAAMMRWWDGDPAETVSLPEAEDVKEGTFTSSFSLLQRHVFIHD